MRLSIKSATAVALFAVTATAFFAITGPKPHMAAFRKPSTTTLTMSDTSYAYGTSTYEPPTLDPKSALLDAIASGVGKGYYTTSRTSAKTIKKLVAELEVEGAKKIKFPDDFGSLNGRWKLLYSSNVLVVGKLSPLTLNEVFQIIDTDKNLVRNVVYATIAAPMFVETWGRFPIAAVANAARTIHDKASFKVDFALDHTFEISSAEYPAQLKIAVKEVRIINSEKPELRTLALPAIRPLAKAGAGRFDTTYLDSNLRISRGSLGEIRVFERVTEEGDYQDEYYFSGGGYSSRVPSDGE